MTIRQEVWTAVGVCGLVAAIGACGAILADPIDALLKGAEAHARTCDAIAAGTIPVPPEKRAAVDKVCAFRVEPAP